jgi:hypothetical protein
MIAEDIQLNFILQLFVKINRMHRTVDLLMNKIIL